MDTILVLGGTGLLGRPVVGRLLDDGFHVRVLARDPERAAATLPRSATIVPGDATRPDDVASAMAGCDGVHLGVGGPAEGVAVQAVADAAPRCRIRRITYLSGSTVAVENAWFPLVAIKLGAEHALRASPVPATILRPTWVMEQLPRFVRDGRATVIGDQPHPLHWLAAEDLARMVSGAFRTPQAADATLHAHGPEAIPFRFALERYCRAEHPDARVDTVPITAARAAVRASGDRKLGLETELMAYFDRVQELGTAERADRVLGPNTITLDAWLTRRRGTVPT